MKRIRKNKSNLSLFNTEKVLEKTIRKRKNKDIDDPFINRYAGQNYINLLKDFLKNRKEYVTTKYPENQRIVALYELDLYEQILNRIIKGIYNKIIIN